MKAGVDSDKFRGFQTDNIVRKIDLGKSALNSPKISDYKKRTVELTRVCTSQSTADLAAKDE